MLIDNQQYNIMHGCLKMMDMIAIYIAVLLLGKMMMHQQWLKWGHAIYLTNPHHGLNHAQILR